METLNQRPFWFSSHRYCLFTFSSNRLVNLGFFGYANGAKNFVKTPQWWKNCRSKSFCYARFLSKLLKWEAEVLLQKRLVMRFERSKQNNAPVNFSACQVTWLGETTADWWILLVLSTLLRGGCVHAFFRAGEHQNRRTEVAKVVRKKRLKSLGYNRSWICSEQHMCVSTFSRP